jgi:hypothetical protein
VLHDAFWSVVQWKNNISSSELFLLPMELGDPSVFTSDYIVLRAAHMLQVSQVGFSQPLWRVIL